MLYSILINQKSVIENDFKIKANHIAVLETVAYFMINGAFVSFEDDFGRWHLISNKIILKEIPMFEIGVSRCRQLIKDLCVCGLLEAHPNKQLSGQYLKIGRKYKKFKNQ